MLLLLLMAAVWGPFSSPAAVAENAILAQSDNCRYRLYFAVWRKKPLPGGLETAVFRNLTQEPYCSQNARADALARFASWQLLPLFAMVSWLPQLFPTAWLWLHSANVLRLLLSRLTLRHGLVVDKVMKEEPLDCCRGTKTPKPTAYADRLCRFPIQMNP